MREHLALNGCDAELFEAAAGSRRGFVRLTTGLKSANRLLLGQPGEIPMVRIDDICGDRVVAGMKVDVEGAERLVLEGARRALEQRRIRLLQLEWNGLSQEVLGEDRKPVVDILAQFGYALYHAGEFGKLSPAGIPESRPGAPDVVARPR